ncbi:MAG: glycosyltransferase [Bacteroidota bacterium]
METKEMPNIIHLVLGLPSPYTMAGINVVVHHLAQNMLDSGYPVSVWSLNDHLSPEFVPEYPLQIFIRHKNRLRVPSNMIQAIKELPKNTVVHIHAIYTMEVKKIARLLRKYNIPYIVTPHGALAFKSLKKKPLLKIPYLMLFERSIIKGAKAVHALGEMEWKELSRWNPNVHIVPNAIEIVDLDDPALIPESTTQLRFCFLGRLTIYIKGLDILLDGFKRYRAAGGTGILRIIGGGHDEEKFQSMVQESGVADYVELMGPRFGEEKNALISECQVFALTSRSEGMPMSVLEGCSLAKSILVSPQTNMGGLIRQHNAGIALPQNTAELIQEALHTFEEKFEDGTLSEFGQNARKMITDSLNWPNVVKRIAEEIYLA